MNYSVARRLSNRILHLLARFLPGARTVRPLLHRLRGVRIHGKVFIGDDVYLENEHPECVEIHDEAIIGLRSIIVAHTRGCGQIVIGSKACLGAGCIVVCHVGQKIEIGEGAVVGAGAIVSRSVPPRTLCAGPRAIELGTVTVPLTCDASYDAFIGGLLPLSAANGDEQLKGKAGLKKTQEKSQRSA